MIKYNQYKSISKEFSKKESKENTISFNKLTNNMDNSYMSIGNIKINQNINCLSKNNQDINSKYNLNEKIIHENCYAHLTNVYKCDNMRCIENKKMYEELRKNTLKLKFENENLRRKCLEMGADVYVMNEFTKLTEKSILNK